MPRLLQAHSAVSNHTPPSLEASAYAAALVVVCTGLGDRGGGLAMALRQGGMLTCRCPWSGRLGLCVVGCWGWAFPCWGHGFGQDSDMVFTGDTLPALLHGVRATQ